MNAIFRLFVLMVIVLNLRAMELVVEDSSQADAAREKLYREKAVFGSYEADFIRYIDQYPVNRVPLIMLYASFLESNESGYLIEMADFMMVRVLKKSFPEICQEAAAEFEQNPKEEDQNEPQLRLRNGPADNPGQLNNGGPIRYRDVALVAGGTLFGAYVLKKYWDRKKEEEAVKLHGSVAQEINSMPHSTTITQEEKQRLFARRDEALRKLEASRGDVTVTIPEEVGSVFTILAMYGSNEHKTNEFRELYPLVLRNEAVPSNLVLNVINHLLLILPSYRDKFAPQFYATCVKHCEEFKATLEKGAN